MDWRIAVVGLAGCLSSCAPPADERAAAPSGGAAGESPSDQAWFQDVAARVGVDFVHRSGHRNRPYTPEIMGGGGALVDLNDDGWIDLYLVQSGSLHEPGSEKGRNRLYLNRGDGTFEDVTEGSGADDRGYGMGCAAADHDGDGDIDLYVTNYGPNVLLRNDGGGRFTDVSEASGAADPGWSSSATFADLDADGDLDLWVANYVNWSMETEIDCPNHLGQLDYCLPTNYESPARDTLFRNDGDGTFTDVSETAGLASDLGNGLGVVAGDFDGDHRLDVFVANDMVFDHLWMNRGGLRFESEGLLRGVAVDENGLAKAGMGVMAVDLDEDADRDLLVVNFALQSDSFYENDGGFFADRTVRVGLGSVSRRYTRFGTGFQDFDNDGRLDVFFSNGRVAAAAEPWGPDPYAEPNLLLRGTADGTFAEVASVDGTDDPLIFTSRAAVFGDIDNDGGVDVVVLNRDAPVNVLRNVRRGRGHWISFRVREEGGRDALGATLTIRFAGRTVMRDVISGYSYLAANDPRVHLGLGDATRVDEVVVRWIDGATESFGGFDADRIVEIRRGDSG